jgi:hypothetical protein
VSHALYVSNTDAHNEVRFEGPGIISGSSVRGHLAEARITVIQGGTVTPRHLNKHIDYDVVPSPQSTNDASLATPTGMAVTSDGATLYVAAFGSSEVGVFSTSALENDTFVPSAASHMPVSGGGPSGLVLDETNGRLYVLTRFDNAVSVLDTTSGMESQHIPFFNPEPASITNGRRFLYDAHYTSSNGEAACASCHIFGDFDSLAWDLGNPDDVVLPELNPFRVGQAPPPAVQAFPNHHPMKGPMTTQSLRGMANNGPMHWRGDRSGANDNPPHNALDEDAAFKRFNVAFGGLLGRSGPLDPDEMQAFTDFILQVTYPPNPVRALDNSLTSDQSAGRTFFMTSSPSDVFQTCDGCHRLDPPNGHFGTDGFSSFENETQFFKIPHLRNLYQKVGMFGMAAVPFFNSGDNGNKGAQVRGFGFLHDGGVDTVFRFHNAFVFDQTIFGVPGINPGGFPDGAAGDTLRRQVEQFILAFDSDLAPIVGQQVTLGPTSGGDSQARATLLLDRAAVGECDVVVKGTLAGEARGWWLTNGVFQSDRLAQSYTDSQLRSQASGGEPRTYLCVPPGSGKRIGIDRDEDGFLDRDELDAGSDPADPASTPTMAAALKVTAAKLQAKDAIPDNEIKRKIVFVSKDPAITTPLPGGPGDPRCQITDPPGTVHARIRFASATSGQSHTSDLPCQNWTLLGNTTSPKGFRYRDPEQNDGTAKSITWKFQTLKASLTGKGQTVLDYDLQVGSDETPLAGRFTSGTVNVCFECDTAFKGKNGSDGKQFLGKLCPAPTGCVGSPSGAFVE